MGKRKRSRSRSRRERSSSSRSFEERLKGLEKSILQLKRRHDGHETWRGRRPGSPAQREISLNQAGLSRSRSPEGCVRKKPRVRSPGGSARRDISSDRLSRSPPRSSRSQSPSSLDYSLIENSPIGRGTRSREQGEDQRDTLILHDEGILEGNTLQEVALDEETLKCLREDTDMHQKGTVELQKDLAGAWTDMLLNGIKKETKEELLNKYKVPPNCLALKPPVLNEEIKHVAPPASLRRDKYQVILQSQLGAGLAALGAATNILLEKKEQFNVLLPIIGDAGKILTDLYYTMSKSRRYYITPCLSKAAKEVADSNPIDEFLLGTNFAEKCKAGKAVENLSKEIKGLTSGPQINKSKRVVRNPPQTLATQQRPSGYQYQANPLNRQGPSHRWREREGRKGRYPQKQETRRTRR